MIAVMGLLFLAAAAVPNTAHFRRAEPGYTLDVRWNLRTDGRTSAHVETTAGHCSGEFEGSGTWNGRTLRVTAPPDPQFPDACAVTLRVSETGNSVSVSETDCLAWHGVSCSLDGTAERVQGGRP